MKQSIKYGHKAAIMAAALSLSLASGQAQADVQAGVVKYETGDFSGAIQEWLPLASANDPNALFNLGQVYRLGRGVDKDMKAARNYYERAARLGHVSAQGNLGTLYFFSDDKKIKDQEKAVSWWQEAATNGDARSQYMLGVLFFNGDVLDRDWTRAYAWMSLAAAAGLPEASQAETSMLKHMTASQVADAREVSLTLVNPTGAFPNSMPVQFASNETAVNPATAQPASVSDVSPAAAPAQTPSAAPVSAVESAPFDSEPPEATFASIEDSAPSVADSAEDFASEATQVASADQDIPAEPYISEPSPVVDYNASADAAMADDYAYKLQLAAFSTEAKANNGWNVFSGKHGDVLATLAPDVTPVEIGEKTLYRLYATGFVTKSDASNACALLKSQGQGCLVVSAN